MRPIEILILSAAVCCSAQAAPFENLTFDEPHTNAFVPNGFGEQMAPMADAIPGWSLELRSDRFSGAYTGEVNVLQLATSIEPVVLLYPPASFFSPSHGFSLYFSFTPPDQPPGPGMWFYQVGDVPPGAQQFRFLSLGVPVLHINERSLPLTEGSLPYEEVADISAWAGQTVRLEFYAPGPIGFFDIIGFSSVPEPSGWALLLLGLPCLVWYLSLAQERERPRRRSHPAMPTGPVVQPSAYDGRTSAAPYR
jgi:hypothetical protein